jgi:hypothetical protein
LAGVSIPLLGPLLLRLPLPRLRLRLLLLLLLLVVLLLRALVAMRAGGAGLPVIG